MRQRDNRVKGVASGYPGGKAGLGIYHRIINQIPPHDIYIEPFLGGGAIMYYKRPALLDVGVDLNGDTITAAKNYLPWAQLHHGDGLEYIRLLLGWEIQAEMDRSRDVDRRQINGRRPLQFSARQKRMVEPKNRRRVAPPFPDPVALLGGPAAKPRILLYCDPPYLLSTRRSQTPLYKHEVGDQSPDGKDDSWHTSLLNLLDALPYQIMLSGYMSKLYAKNLRAPKWRAISYQAPLRNGMTATEYLWCNFPQPCELHDYRYLGENRRERERIKRKKTRWTNKLKVMPDLERYAILAAIQAAQLHEGANNGQR